MRSTDIKIFIHKHQKSDTKNLILRLDKILPPIGVYLLKVLMAVHNFRTCVLLIRFKIHKRQ